MKDQKAGNTKVVRNVVQEVGHSSGRHLRGACGQQGKCSKCGDSLSTRVMTPFASGRGGSALAHMQSAIKCKSLVFHSDKPASLFAV